MDPLTKECKHMIDTAKDIFGLSEEQRKEIYDCAMKVSDTIKKGEDEDYVPGKPEGQNKPNKYMKHEYSLLALIEELHMNISGSSDTMDDEEKRMVYREILNRVDNWDHLFSNYDECVRELCLEVLGEYRDHLTDE